MQHHIFIQVKQSKFPSSGPACHPALLHSPPARLLSSRAFLPSKELGTRPRLLAPRCGRSRMVCCRSQFFFLVVETMLVWAGEVNNIPRSFFLEKHLYSSLGGTCSLRHLRPQNFQSRPLEEVLRSQWCCCFQLDEVLLILVNLHYSM